MTIKTKPGPRHYHLSQGGEGGRTGQTDGGRPEAGWQEGQHWQDHRGAGHHGGEGPDNGHRGQVQRHGYL
jgi:hypothetical protein